MARVGNAALLAAARTTASDQNSLWLRKLKDDRELLLAVSIDLEEQDDGNICATVDGLDDVLVGMGSTKDEAVQSAHLLLLSRVDHAIECGDPVESVLGDVVFGILPVNTLATIVKQISERTAARHKTSPSMPDWVGYMHPAFFPAEARA